MALATGATFWSTCLRTWGRCSLGCICIAGRRRRLLSLLPFGTRKCRTGPGTSCSCRQLVASCRSWWISLVARRRDVIDGRSLGATASSRQSFATNRLRECWTGRAVRPSRSSNAGRRPESTRFRSLFDACFSHLERAHVLARRMTGRHTHVHWLMLVAGWHQRDYREVVGQVPRMLTSIVSMDCQEWIYPSMGAPSGRLRAICWRQRLTNSCAARACA